MDYTIRYNAGAGTYCVKVPIAGSGGKWTNFWVVDVDTGKPLEFDTWQACIDIIEEYQTQNLRA